MDFTKTVNSKADAKYSQMLSGTARSPFEQSMTINSPQQYVNNTAAYLKRLNAEKEAFNSALGEIRMVHEKNKQKAIDGEEKAAHFRFRLFQVIKMFAFLLPLAVIALGGWDLLNPDHVWLQKLSELIHLETIWIIVIFGAVCAVVGYACISLIVNMFKKGTFYNRNWITNLKPYTVAAIIFFILAVALAGTNLYFMFTHSLI